MKEVLSRLDATGDFDIFLFGDDLILNKPVEEVLRVPLVSYIRCWSLDIQLLKAES